MKRLWEEGTRIVRNYLWVIFLLNFCFAQELSWKKVIGGLRLDSPRDLEVLANGDYVFVGTSTSFSQGDSDVYVVRLNPNGDKLWEKTYGGYGQDIAYSISKTADGNMVIAGSSTSAGSAGREDIYVLKISPTGALIWNKKYGHSRRDIAREIKQTADGGYIVTGLTEDDSTGHDAFLLKLNPQGTKEWMESYGGVKSDHGMSVKEVPGAGYILYGQTFSYGKNGDFYLVHTDLDGDITWEKNYGGDGEDEGQYILVNVDGSFIMVGDKSVNPADSNDFDVNITKTDSKGIIQWQKKYGGAKKDVVKMIQPTKDGGYIVGAITRSFALEPDYWVMKIKSNGDTSWTRMFGGIDHEHCYAVKQTSDGGYIVAGHSDSFEKDNVDAYILKLTSSGQLRPVGINEINDVVLNDINVYPSPATGYFNIQLALNKPQISKLRITNITGEIVHEETISQSVLTKKVSTAGYAKGVYLINILSENAVITKKIVVL